MLKSINLVLNYHIIHNLKENKWGESFAKLYLHEKILNWFYSSSEKSDASSDSNTLKSCNDAGELAFLIVFDFASNFLLLLKRFKRNVGKETI